MNREGLAREILLNINPRDLLVRCKNPRGPAEQICSDENFWRERAHLDFGEEIKQPISPQTWKNYYGELLAEQEIIDVVDHKILAELRNDVFYKRKQIIEKYSQELWNGYRVPQACVGRYEKLQNIDINEELRLASKERSLSNQDLGLPESWLLLQGHEGKLRRKELIDQNLQEAFYHYYKGLSKPAKQETDYYGAAFIGLINISGELYYGTPDTINDYDVPINFEYTTYTTPKAIIDGLQNLIKQGVQFIKLYLFISPTEISIENFRWVMEYTINGHDFYMLPWIISGKETRDFMMSLFWDPRIDSTPYPIITKTTFSGCHKKQCGPWISSS